MRSGSGSRGLRAVPFSEAGPLQHLRDWRDRANGAVQPITNSGKPMEPGAISYSPNTITTFPSPFR